MKKFTTICMAFIIMVMVMLTGCSTFSVDKVSYYNEVVAKVGDEKIIRFDLINAYNNYGYNQFVTQQGQSEEEALSSTLNLLIERKLLAKYAKDNPSKYTLTEYEINNLMQSVLDYLKESFADNMATARKIYGIEEPESSVEEDEAKESIKLSDYRYEKRVTVENGQIKYVDVDTDEVIEEYALDSLYITNFADYTDTEIINALLAEFKSDFYYNENNEENYDKLCDKAIQLACNNLISYEYYLRDENGKRFSTNEKDLLFRYVQRTYNSEVENAYITKVNTVYLQNETLSNESIVKAFNALYKRDYATYKNDTSSYATKIIGTDSDLIYYTPSSNDKFGYFLHVLLPFNNKEADLKQLKEDKEAWYQDDIEGYKSAQKALIDQIMCAERTISEVHQDGKLIHEEGVVLEEEKSILTVLDEYRANVNDLNSFVEFMFRYTTDNATLTADMPYIIGYNTETDAEHSSMVENFTDEAIRLMKNNERYTDADNYIVTNYGIHLLYYVAPVENQITYEELAQVTVQDLASTVLNQATGETYLDRLFDLVYPANSDGMFTTNTQYGDFETVLVDSLDNYYPVEIYETKVKGSTKL